MALTLGGQLIHPSADVGSFLGVPGSSGQPPAAAPKGCMGPLCPKPHLCGKMPWIQLGCLGCPDPSPGILTVLMRKQECARTFKPIWFCALAVQRVTAQPWLTHDTLIKTAWGLWEIFPFNYICGNQNDAGMLNAWRKYKYGMIFKPQQPTIVSGFTSQVVPSHLHHLHTTRSLKISCLFLNNLSVFFPVTLLIRWDVKLF